MVTDKDGNILIHVEMKMPWADSPVCVDVKVSAHAARALAPLQRDHDVPFMPIARAEAQRQRQERMVWYKILSAQIAMELSASIQKHDPVNGYAQNEH